MHDGAALASHWETLAWLKEHGFPINPFAERLESIDAVAKACRDWERKRGDLDYEIDGIVIKVDDYAQQQRLGALHSAAAVGARVQVGADDGDDAAREDHDPRRPHRRAQPVGDPASRSRSAA